MKVALIDGDSIIYILAWQFKDQEAEGDNFDLVRGAVDQFVQGILIAVEATDYIGAIGHASEKCFRYKVAKYKPYKGTRKPKDEWVLRWEQTIRQRLIEQWGFVTIATLEADDIVALAAEYYSDGGCGVVICSPDKDLRQIPGKHFDYKKTEFIEVSPEEAEYNYYYQLLVGDDTDNIAGLPGFGPKKAEEKLKSMDLGFEFYEHVIRGMYNKYFGEYYGTIIFEENSVVLGLVNSSHLFFDGGKHLIDILEQKRPVSRQPNNAAAVFGFTD